MPPLLPACPFPPLHWWHVALSTRATVDMHEPFVKQSLRSRLKLSGADGGFEMPLALEHAERRKRPKMPMSEMAFSSHIPLRHLLRTLQTAYGKTPFYEHVMPELEALLCQVGVGTNGGSHGELVRASVQLMWSWSGETAQPVRFSTGPQAGAAEGAGADLRHKSVWETSAWRFATYLQPFQDRNGFVAGCSGLDALFCVGPEWLDLARQTVPRSAVTPLQKD